MFGKKKGDQESTEMLNLQITLLKEENKNLKKEIDLLWSLTNEKQSNILKLRKIIIEYLQKPEYLETFEKLDGDLKDMFNREIYYIPNSEMKLDFVQEVSRNEEKSDEIINSQQIKSMEKPAEIDGKGNSQESQKDQKKEEDRISIDGGKIQIQKDQITGVEGPTSNQEPKTNDNKKMIRLRKMKQQRRYQIKPKDSETVIRDLYVLELELKKYSQETFDKIKGFIQKSDFTPEEIHDEIENHAIKLAGIKYFTTVYPENTLDKCMNVLENYIFEIIHHKIFKIDEDQKGYAQQLNDRLTVLRKIITFDMLDIPLSLREQEYFIFAIKEFEKMRKFRSPILKIEAFQNCANHLIDLYIDIQNKVPDADELFPLLMYVVLNSDLENLRIHVE